MSPQVQVDDDFLKAMGLDGLEGEAKDNALADILYTLNINVGKRVADQLPGDKAVEFENLADSETATEDEISDWLDKNIPNYSQLIEEEAQKMRDEVTSIADKVMGGNS